MPNWKRRVGMLCRFGVVSAGLAVAFGCSAEEPERAPRGELQLSEALRIEGNETGDGEAPILSFAGRAAVNSAGEIFLLDTRESRIHHYDRQGNWLTSFGGPGAGPGELGQITTLHVDRSDRLLAADREHARITVFEPDGSLAREAGFSGLAEMGSIRSIRQMPDGRYLFTGHDGEKMVHIVDEDLEGVESSLVDIEDFAGEWQGMQQRWFQIQGGHAEPLDEDLIAFVPATYQGRVYLYRQDEPGEWEPADPMEGYRRIEPSVTFHSSEPRSGEAVHGVMMSPEEGELYITFHARSYGFFRHDDGPLYHLLYRHAPGEEDMQLVVERFDAGSRQLTTYGINEELELGHSMRIEPEWMDSDGRIYLTDNSDLPAVRVMQTELTQTELP